MPAKNPRINVVLDNALYKHVSMLAEKDNLSLSAEVKNLLLEAIEIHEDVALARFAEEREKTWDDKTALSHEDVWK